MTVAAVLIAPSPADALAPTEGLPLVRRLIDVAWSGGAMPVVVVVPDPGDDVARAVDGTPALVVSPAPDEPRGIAWFTAGLEAALATVTGTRAALLWPVRYAWLDPETVTSLIEAHGAQPASIVRAAFGGAPGFPALVPSTLLGRLRELRGRTGEEALAALAVGGVPAVLVELGDPGVTHDASTALTALPPFEGPAEPVAGPPPEWGASEAPLAAEE